MTEDELMSLGEQAGLKVKVTNTGAIIHPDGMKRFANLIAAAEREACAKLCDDLADKDKLSNYYRVAANAIRQRSNA